MIKLKDELVNFPIIDLNALSKKGSFPENIKTAVSLYNKAIDRIKFNSSDIAIIELKKAIKMFPEFYDAILLLSLCYYANDEKTRAVNLLNSIKDDEERRKCFKYLDSVVGKSVSGAKPIIRRTEPSNQKGHQGNRQNRAVPERRSHDYQRNNKSFSYYAKVLLNNPLVFRATALLMILLISAGLIYGLFTLYNVNKQRGAESAKVAELETKYSQEYNRAQKAVLDLANFKGNYEELAKYVVDWLISLEKATQYKTIVEVTYLLDTTLITDSDTVSKIEQLKNDSLTLFGENTFSNAENDLTENKRDEAINKLESIIKYYPNYMNISKVKLTLGKAYRDKGDNAKAIEVLNDLIEFHGQTAEAVEAKSIRDELTNGNNGN